MKHIYPIALAFSLAACHGNPPPKALIDADRAQRSPSVIETETSAPQAKASADALRKKAWQLAHEGKNSEAAIVAEQASAAYEVAVALGRRARASARIEKARELAEKKKIELSTLEADQARLEGEIEALELRARVQEDRQAIGDEEKLTGERAEVRRRAAFVLYREAEVLCAGARLLGADEKNFEPLRSELTALGTRLGQGSVERDIFPRASAVRAQCLKTLTDIRAGRSLSQPESAANDIFLTEATALELPAERDDRGLVIRLTDILGGKSLAVRTLEQLEKTAKLALGHPDSPIVLVVHTASSAENSKAQGWADEAKGALARAGISQVETLLAGHTAPLVSRHSSAAATMNRRIEIVFVSPQL